MTAVSNPEPQPEVGDQYVDLYFDLEHVTTELVAAQRHLEEAMNTITKVYRTEDEGGMERPDRKPIDIATRAAVSSSLAMFFPLLRQLHMSLHFSKQACEAFSPVLQHRSSTAH